MRRFAALVAEIDATTRTSAKVAALAAYFRTAPEPDRLWTVALLSHRRPRRAVTTTRLREWAAEAAGLPLWLVEECHPIVGDLAETIALILPPPETPQEQSLSDWIAWLASLQGQEESARKTAILDAWRRLPVAERLVFAKLITGGFRMGVSQTLMIRALSEATGRDVASLTHRLMGDWTPATTDWSRLVLAEDAIDDLSRPYPFCLAHPAEDPAMLGPASDWLAEWKWDGIRGQLIRRGDRHWLWSRGEELITDRFPEFAALRDALPQGTVLDGEILAWDRTEGQPLPFSALQPRIGRKSVPKRLLAEAPAHMLAYDLLEWQGADLRHRPLGERRGLLDGLLSALPAGLPLSASPSLGFKDWAALARLRDSARDRQAEGLMLKRRDSPYHAGRRKGDWWKWKLAPFTVDLVMIYAQSGSGRRANLFTDFTFAARDGDTLVPVAKAYSGLTDAEFDEITRWVRKHTQQRFGPVRQVSPELVFEIAFDGIQTSPRHKSGISLRFPRMARWRRDKPAGEIDTLAGLRDLLTRFG